MADPEEHLPLDQWHRARGARMVPFAGYAMPVQYEGIIAEHLWTRRSASLFDVSHMGQVRVTGREVDHALETQLPSDLVGLRQDQLRYSFLLNERGGIVDDLIATRVEGGFQLVVNGATKHGDVALLRDRLPNLSFDLVPDALLALQGPRAAEALARLAPGVEALGFMTAGAFVIDSVPVWITRSGYTGEDGFEISVPVESVQTVADLLAEQPEVRPAGLGARDALRLEAGLPLYGHDLDEDRTPVEAGLSFAISKRRRGEGGFPGYDRIREQLETGAASRRVGLAVEGRQPVREGAEVVGEEGSIVGRVTSGGYSPILEAPIAMAYVPAERASPGSGIPLLQRGRSFAARVVQMPFVPHRYHRKESAR